MSDLITNLNSIYTTKLQIKEVIGTDSDVFSDYPAYIEAAISGGGLDWDDVAGYGYIVPAGTYNITTNGTHDVTNYASAYVSVETPIDWAEVEASGYTYVKNETYMFNNHIRLTSDGDLLGVVSAPGYEAVELHYGLENLVNQNAYEITTNGNFDVLTYGTAYVNVQGGAAVLGYTNITTNGTTYASTYDLDGFSYVTVNVPTSGGTTYTLIDDVSDISASDQLVTATVVSTADNYATYITPEMAQQNPLFEHFVGTYVSDKAKLNGTEILFAAAQYFGKGTYMCNATTYIMNMGGSNMYCLTAGDNLHVGGVPAYGTYNINTNGTFDISSYQYCSVNVPEPTVTPAIFMQEQFGDLGYFYDMGNNLNYYVTGNYKFGYQYEVTLKPYYDDNQTPMIYNVVNVVEIGLHPEMQTYTETRYYSADSYHQDNVSYGYGSNRYNSRFYFYAKDSEEHNNMFLLSQSNSTIDNLTGGEQLSITYIKNGEWNLVLSVEVVNS